MRKIKIFTADLNGADKMASEINEFVSQDHIDKRVEITWLQSPNSKSTQFGYHGASLTAVLSYFEKQSA